MNKEDAIKALRSGKKISHKYFSSDEYIEQKEGFYYDEKGYQIDIESFWYYRRNDGFEDGFEIYESLEK